MRKIRVHKREERPVTPPSAAPAVEPISTPLAGYGDIISVGGHGVTDTEFAYAISRYCDANGGGVEAVQNLVESKLGDSLPHRVLSVPITRRTVSDMLRGCGLEVTYSPRERTYVIELRNVLDDYHCQLEISVDELENLRHTAIFSDYQTRRNHVANRLTDLIIDAWRTQIHREVLRMLINSVASHMNPFGRAII